MIQLLIFASLIATILVISFLNSNPKPTMTEVLLPHIRSYLDHYNYCIENMNLEPRECTELALKHPEIIEEHYYSRELHHIMRKAPQK